MAANEGYHDRFKGADWYGIDVPVVIGGAGGLGSWLTFFLTRLGLTKVGVYDFDSVEAHNLSGQLFHTGQIGKSKVEALWDTCKLYSDTEIYTFNQKYDEKSMRADYMFACFDNMKARSLMFTKWKLKDTRQLFVDIRLDFEQIDIFYVTKETEDKFIKDHLFSDEEATEPQCTMKQTTHVAALATSLAVAGFTNFISPASARTVPFHQLYLIPINYHVLTKAV